MVSKVENHMEFVMEISRFDVFVVRNAGFVHLMCKIKWWLSWNSCIGRYLTLRNIEYSGCIFKILAGAIPILVKIFNYDYFSHVFMYSELCD